MRANADERDAARDLLEDKRDLSVMDDKGFIKAELARDLLERRGIRLLTLPRANQKHQVSGEVRRLFNQVRQIIETVNGQLTEQFQIEINHAHSFWACARAYTPSLPPILCAFRSIACLAILIGCESNTWLFLPAF